MSLKFADLFAGIGGFRLALESADCECVFSSEIDKWACLTYAANFGDRSRNDTSRSDRSRNDTSRSDQSRNDTSRSDQSHSDTSRGDITKIRSSDIPRFDILTAGFPCQPFSSASYGRKGFDDTRGTLFFEIARILSFHEPKAFILENVKGLLTHDRGRTFDTIMRVLTKQLRYQVFHKVLDSQNFGVPQHRERVYIVGFRRDLPVTDFDFPNGNGERKCIRDIMEHEPPAPCYYVSARAYETLKRHKARHETRKNGLGFRLCDPDG